MEWPFRQSQPRRKHSRAPWAFVFDMKMDSFELVYMSMEVHGVLGSRWFGLGHRHRPGWNKGSEFNKILHYHYYYSGEIKMQSSKWRMEHFATTLQTSFHQYSIISDCRIFWISNHFPLPTFHSRLSTFDSRLSTLDFHSRLSNFNSRLSTFDFPLSTFVFPFHSIPTAKN